MREPHEGNGSGNGGGYDADDEWSGRRTVGDWRRSKKRRKGPPAWSWMKESMITEDIPNDHQYEADDEWPPRPKISQIRQFMKRKTRKPPKGPRESSDTGMLLSYLYEFAVDSLKTTYNVTSLTPTTTNANAESASLATSSSILTIRTVTGIERRRSQGLPYGRLSKQTENTRRYH